MIDETDIDVRLGYGRWPGFELEFLLRDPLVPLCAPATFADLGPTLNPDRLAAQSLVHVMSTEDHWANYFSLLGLPPFGDVRGIHVDSSITEAEIAAVSRRFALIQSRFTAYWVQSSPSQIVFA